LAEGKPTLPLIRAMQVGGSAEQGLLRSAIADGGSDDIESVLRAVESTDAIHYTSAAAQRYAAAAQSALANVPPSDYRTAMSQLADFTVSRTL
ncbi:MAG: octaprenyl diphosphate synthase, partial [Algiphilus sp.]